jgi:transposase-like protein
VARPIKLTQARQDRICDAIRDGAYAEVAARAAGVAASTYYEWRRRGRLGEEPFSEFLEALAQAEAEAELEAVAVIARRR